MWNAFHKNCGKECFFPWDDKVSTDSQAECHYWCNELSEISNLIIQRICINWTQEESNDKIEIHSLCDASKRAYGVAVCMRILKENALEVSLVASKCWVAPLREIVLPRLEFLGALVATRLTNRIKYS